MTSETTIRIHNTPEFRACQTAVNLKEGRLHLRGVYLELDVDRVTVTGTDGKRLATYSEPLDYTAGALPAGTHVLVQFPRVIAATAQHVDITLDEAKEKSIAVVKRARSSKTFAIESSTIFLYWDVKFPEYRKIVDGARYDKDRSPTAHRIGFDALLLADIQKAVGEQFSELRIKDEHSALDVRFLSHPALEVVLMPCRL